MLHIGSSECGMTSFHNVCRGYVSCCGAYLQSQTIPVIAHKTLQQSHTKGQGHGAHRNCRYPCRPFPSRPTLIADRTRGFTPPLQCWHQMFGSRLLTEHQHQTPWTRDLYCWSCRGGGPVPLRSPFLVAFAPEPDQLSYRQIKHCSECEQANGQQVAACRLRCVLLSRSLRPSSEQDSRSMRT